MPHLMDMLAAKGLILAGGFGIRVKQDYLASIQAKTLLTPVPPARATSDLDFFLTMEIFMSDHVQQSIRDIIDRLGYAPKHENWQFAKQLANGFSERQVTLDLLSRHPTETENVKLRPPRVGEGPLHGRNTAEAFAINIEPTHIALNGHASDGRLLRATVSVPHPYAWINMKVRASYDWLRMTRGEIKPKPFSEKHAYDVYTLVAMLQDHELSRGAEIASKFEDHPVAILVREQAPELFSTRNSAG